MNPAEIHAFAGISLCQRRRAVTIKIGASHEILKDGRDWMLRLRASANRQAKSLERAKGIEPSYAAWEAAVLPLNYARDRLSLT